jgi:integrase
MDPQTVEKGAEALTGVQRAFYDFLRFTGARLDEGNKLKWTDLDLDRGLFLMPGSKTPDAADVRPLPTHLIKKLLELPRTSEYVFPAHHGGKAYDRRKLFRKVSKQAGIKITAKDLRDWFGTQVVALTNDPRQIMDLMRHTNLRTTTTYMRRVSGELRSIVDSLGGMKDG